MGWLKDFFGGNRTTETSSDFADLRPESERKMEHKAQSRLSAKGVQQWEKT
jgi:hypothetical protein